MSKQSEQPDKLTLDDVVELGGEKADLELIGNLSDEGEILENQEDFEAEPIKREEIFNFIKGIGLDKYRDHGSKLEDEKEKKKRPKVKLAVMSDQEEEENEINEQEAASSKPGKKKTKNKYKVQEEEVSSTTASLDTSDVLTVPSGFTNYLSAHQPRKHLLAKPGGKWMDHQFRGDPTTFNAVKPAELRQLKQFADKLLEEDAALYKKQKEGKKRSGAEWMRTVLKSGTVSDKMAALTVMVQESPIHNLDKLDLLIGLVKKKGRREALTAVDTLKELFISDLLFDDRKLKTFDQHPFDKLEVLTSGNRDSRDRRLLLWNYETQLKDKFANFVKAVEALSHDNVAAAKKKAVGVIFELLAAVPEQEKSLLTMLVNKLGDPDHKVASKAAHLLCTLAEKHPNMKTVLVLEVEQMLYRPNINVKAQYYGVCFLNQLLLDHEDRQLAARLITIYFSFFKAYVKRGDVDSKMLSALLTGVNRAYPYAKLEKAKLTDQVDTLYKMVHIVNFNTSIQALMLLYQVTDPSDSSGDRYYQALYRKLLDPGLHTSSKQTLFLNLLFKSLKVDQAVRRIQAFVKRLLQVCCLQAPPFICAALILLSELTKVKPAVLATTKAAEDSDDEEEHFIDAPDESDEEGLDRNIESKNDNDANSDHQVVLSSHGHTTVKSWVHRQTMSKSGTKSVHDVYDPHCRNPLYCRADQDCVWELEKLILHYHPTVVLFAQSLLKGEKVTYPGDPLSDFTLIRFLDRFVYRNPKKKDKLPTNASILQAKKKDLAPRGIRAIPVNSEEYLKKGEASIPVDEKFFYRYFSQQAAKSASKVDDMDSDAGSISDAEFDDFLDHYEKDFDQDADINFDFAGEFGRQKEKKKTKSKKDAGDSEEDDDDDLGDLSDEEVDFGEGFDAEFTSDVSGEDEDVGVEEGAIPDFDEEGISFSDDDDGGLEELDLSKGKKGKKKRVADSDDGFLGPPPSKRGKKKMKDSGELFAAAEEFADLIDENDAKFDTISSGAMANKDKASVKQLKWEANRDRWMHDRDWKSKKRGQRGQKGNWKKGPQNKQRTARKPPPHKAKGKGKRKR